MKKTMLTIIGIAAMSAPAGFGQVLINGLNITYSENFNSYAGTALSIPSNFTFSDNDFTPGGVYDSAGTYNDSNSNYALIDSNVSATDRAFGQKGPTSGTDFLNWSFVNDSGISLSNFTVSWDFKQFSEAGRATTLAFNYNPNSTGFTTSGITGTRISTATTNTTVGNIPVRVESLSVTVALTTPLANGQSILFGWGFANGAGSGGNAHIGVDNISITAIPEPGTFLLLGIGAAAILIRRKLAKV